MLLIAHAKKDFCFLIVQYVMFYPVKYKFLFRIQEMHLTLYNVTAVRIIKSADAVVPDIFATSTRDHALPPTHVTWTE